MNQFLKFALKELEHLSEDHILFIGCEIFSPWRISLKVVYKSATPYGFREISIDLKEILEKGGCISEGKLLYINEKYEYNTIMRLTKSKNDSSDTTKLSKKKKKIILKYGDIIFDTKFNWYKIHKKMVFGYTNSNLRLIDEL